MKGYAEKVEYSASRLVPRIAVAVHRAIVEGTPVDTGLARSNWIVSLGSPFRGVVPPWAPGDHLGIGETANADVAIKQGEAAILGYRSGMTVFIQNNAPYIGVLNSPSTPSQQADPYFVQMAIKSGVVEALTIPLLGKGP